MFVHRLLWLLRHLCSENVLAQRPGILELNASPSKVCHVLQIRDHGVRIGTASQKSRSIRSRVSGFGVLSSGLRFGSLILNRHRICTHWRMKARKKAAVKEEYIPDFQWDDVNIRLSFEFMRCTQQSFISCVFVLGFYVLWMQVDLGRRNLKNRSHWQKRNPLAHVASNK